VSLKRAAGKSGAVPPAIDAGRGRAVEWAGGSRVVAWSPTVGGREWRSVSIAPVSAQQRWGGRGVGGDYVKKTRVESGRVQS
jgi:hypothetical protein